MEKHLSVLKNEIVEGFAYLAGLEGGYFLDATLGLAGHAIAIAKTNRKIKFAGVDKDEDALSLALKEIVIEGLEDRFILFHTDFKEAKKTLNESDINKVSGILIDLGVSSMQLDNPDRGFSFKNLDSDLDMRMDKSQPKSAFNIVNNYSENDLVRILKDYGEVKEAKIIAKNICASRKEKPIQKVGDLINIVELSIPKRTIAMSSKHFATKVFQAIRIEVNNELTRLDFAIRELIELLDSGGRIAIISFHSLEDRIVKNTFREMENPCICSKEIPLCGCGRKPVVKIITKKPITPSEEEVSLNPRSRSAKLRIAEKL